MNLLIMKTTLAPIASPSMLDGRRHTEPSRHAVRDVKNQQCSATPHSSMKVNGATHRILSTLLPSRTTTTRPHTHSSPSGLALTPLIVNVNRAYSKDDKQQAVKHVHEAIASTLHAQGGRTDLSSKLDYLTDAIVLLSYASHSTANLRNFAGALSGFELREVLDRLVKLPDAAAMKARSTLTNVALEQMQRCHQKLCMLFAKDEETRNDGELEIAIEVRTLLDLVDMTRIDYGNLPTYQAADTALEMKSHWQGLLRVYDIWTNATDLQDCTDEEILRLRDAIDYLQIPDRAMAVTRNIRGRKEAATRSFELSLKRCLFYANQNDAANYINELASVTTNARRLCLYDTIPFGSGKPREFDSQRKSQFQTVLGPSTQGAAALALPFLQSDNVRAELMSYLRNAPDIDLLEQHDLLTLAAETLALEPRAT